MFSALPRDLLIDILSRVPVKSLGKLKCVSKEWLGIISDPHFISMLRKFSLRNPSYLSFKFALEEGRLIPERTRLFILELNSDGSRKERGFSFYMDGIIIEIIESKGDLVALASENSLYVCNPSTQVVKKLPAPNFCTFSGYLQLEMGYCKQGEEYLLVNLFDITSDSMRCQVLRLKEGSKCEWKAVDAICPLIASRGVFIDKSLYWIHCSKNPIQNFDADIECIVSFDIESDTFGTILPPEGVSAHRLPSMADIGEELCLLYGYDVVQIWVLKDVKNDAWISQYKIEMTMPYSISLHTLICLWPWDDTTLIDALSKGSDNGVVSRLINLQKKGHRLTRYIPGFFELQIAAEPASIIPVQAKKGKAATPQKSGKLVLKPKRNVKIGDPKKIGAKDEDDEYGKSDEVTPRKKLAAEHASIIPVQAKKEKGVTPQKSGKLSPNPKKNMKIEDPKKIGAKVSKICDDEDEDDESGETNEVTPRKKLAAELALEAPVQVKKGKTATPQKTDESDSSEEDIPRKLTP